MSKKGQRQQRRLHASAPPSGQNPMMHLAPRDVEAMAEALVTSHTTLHDLWQRREQREWSACSLRGPLADVERKTVAPMVLAVHGPDQAAVRAGQPCLGQGAGDETAIVVRHPRLVAERLGEPAGVVLCDGSGFPQQGTHAVGVARQDCGAVGTSAHGQHGVFAAYPSRKGSTLLDRRLYRPAPWCAAAPAPRRPR
jgi:SRSO17 transposase